MVTDICLPSSHPGACLRVISGEQQKKGGKKGAHCLPSGSSTPPTRAPRPRSSPPRRRRRCRPLAPRTPPTACPSTAGRAARGTPVGGGPRTRTRLLLTPVAEKRNRSSKERPGLGGEQGGTLSWSSSSLPSCRTPCGTRTRPAYSRGRSPGRRLGGIRGAKTLASCKCGI